MEEKPTQQAPETPPPLPEEEELFASPTLESKHGVMVEPLIDMEIKSPPLPPQAPAVAVAAEAEAVPEMERIESELLVIQKPRRRGKNKNKFQQKLPRSWMPPSDWRMERRLRTTGSCAGMVDTFFYHPKTNRQFRSRREVFNYLNGIEPSPRGKVYNKETNDDNLLLGSSILKNEVTEATTMPFDSSNLKNQEKEALKMDFESSRSEEHRGINVAVNFNFEKPAKKVKCVPTDSSWSPFVSDDMVPVSIKQEWATAFASLSIKNGGKISQER